MGIRGQLFMVILQLFAEDLQLVWIVEIGRLASVLYSVIFSTSPVQCNPIRMKSKFKGKIRWMCSIHTLLDLLVVPALWQDGYGATLGEQPPEDTVGAFFFYLVLMGAAETHISCKCGSCTGSYLHSTLNAGGQNCCEIFVLGQ